MDISGISNMAMPMMNPVSDPGSMASAPGPANGMASASMGRMDQLIQLLQGFSSSEVLTALLMSHGPAHQRVHSSHDGSSIATAAFGLAQATQMASMASVGSFMATPAMGAAAGGAGAQISVQG